MLIIYRFIVVSSGVPIAEKRLQKQTHSLCVPFVHSVRLAAANVSDLLAAEIGAATSVQEKGFSFIEGET